MLRTHALLSSLLPFLLVQESTAQALFRVDPSDPSAFSTIQAAVDASSDGDTVLVAAGSYAGFAIEGKGVSIVGDGAVEISQSGPTLLAVVSLVPAGEEVLLRNLAFRPSTSSSLIGELVRITDNAGVVVLEELDIDSELGFGALFVSISQDEVIVVQDSASVVMVNSTVLGSNGNTSSGGGNEIGSHAVSVERSSLFLHGCNLMAGGTTAFGVDGSAALRAVDAVAVLRDCQIDGGGSGPGCSMPFGGICPNPISPGAGGPALLAGPGASTFVIGTVLEGGPGGSDASGGGDIPGMMGPPFALAGDGTVTESVATPTSLATMPVVRAGSNPTGAESTLALSSVPLSTAVLFLDFETTPAFAPGLPGFLSFGLGSIAVFGMTDAAGDFAVDLDLPTFPAPFAFWGITTQGILLTASGELEFSNPSIFTVINN